MYYLIGKTLEEHSKEEILQSELPFAAALAPEEWEQDKDSLGIVVYPEPDLSRIRATKAEEHLNSLTGTFSIPQKDNITGPHIRFFFALNDKGVVFVDDTGTAETYLKDISGRKQWNNPCLERFLYDFLERMVIDDTDRLDKYEKKLDGIEKEIMKDKEADYPKRISKIRNELRELRIHYDQLEELGKELEENGNQFFKEENLRYFRMFSGRMNRLYDLAVSLRDYTVQLVDLYHSQTDLKMNRIMTALTVITAIFMPLTLIVGWYGMNFVYMPELNSRYGYPLVILFSLSIVVGGLLYFRKKKWL